MAARRSVIATLMPFMLLAICACMAPARATDDCWSIIYGAIRHRAAAQHPPFILYDQHSQVSQDGATLWRTSEEITYRDDGVARIVDDRFARIPYLTRETDPGPPVLGPYGDRRQNWLQIDTGDPHVPLIGEVRAASSLQCQLLGAERYRGYNTYHLRISGGDTSKPLLREAWIDRSTSEFWKITVSADFPHSSGFNPPPHSLVIYEIELGQTGPYILVDHVTWKFVMREYAQWSNVLGEYYLSNFSFPQSVPASYFS